MPCSIVTLYKYFREDLEFREHVEEARENEKALYEIEDKKMLEAAYKKAMELIEAGDPKMIALVLTKLGSMRNRAWAGIDQPAAKETLTIQVQRADPRPDGITYTPV